MTSPSFIPHRHRAAPSSLMLVAAGLLLIVPTAFEVGWLVLSQHAAPSSMPQRAIAQDRVASGDDAEGFPAVDWPSLQAENPDIVGWITVPSTAIDQPLVQAHASDPDRYLFHDAHSLLNPFGCPFIDAACEGEGIDAKNCIIYGHNMGWDRSAFGDLAEFSDAGFAAQHRTVLIQTPAERRVLVVIAVNVIPGWQASKRTNFASTSDFVHWWRETRDVADTVFDDGADDPLAITTLCTCSYGRWSSERTLVYCRKRTAA